VSIPVLNMKAYVDKTTLVLGPQERLLGNFQIHPLIREDWSSKDWFCDAMNLGHTLTAYDPYYNETAGSYDPLPANELFYVATTGKRHSGPYNMFHTDPDVTIAHDADWGTLEQAHWIYPPSGWPFSLGTHQSVGANPASALEIWAQPQHTLNQPGVKSAFNVHPRNAAWNEGILGNPTGSMENFLSQEGYGTAWAGDPYFVSYTTRPGGLEPTDDRMAGATTSNESIFNHMVNNTDWIHDHTFIMPENQEVSSQASIGLTVQPVYNYFIDSDPDYESIIAQLPEPMIPNYYMVESSLQEGRDATSVYPANFTYMEGATENGSSYPLRFGFDATQGASQLGSLKALFEGDSSTGPSAPYDNRQGFYQLYASIMEDIIKGNSDMDLATATERANAQFRDIAVLTADLQYIRGGVDIIADNRGNNDTTDDMMAIDGYPFYNMVTISPALPPNFYDNSQYKISGFQHGTGLGAPGSQMGSIFDSLLKNLSAPLKPGDFDTLINTLQLIVCKSLSAASDLPPVLATGISGSTSTTFVRGDNEATTWPRVAAPVRTAGDANYNLPVAFELERLLSYMSPSYDQSVIDPAIPAWDSPASQKDEELARHLHVSWEMNNNIGNENKNFTILRNPAHVSTWHQNLWGTDPGMRLPALDNIVPPSMVRALLDQIAIRARPLGDVWNGTPSFSETFMYVVEKRAIPAGSTTADLSQPPVQKFYFGIPYGAPQDTIQYIDTQIKYGVRYQYDLKEVRVVVGSRYRYTAAESTLNLEDPGQGRALANALGFYKEEGPREAQLVPLEIKLREALFMNNNNTWPYPPYAEEDENVHSLSASIGTPGHMTLNSTGSTGFGWGQGHLIGYYCYSLPGNTTIFDLVGGPSNPANWGPYIFNILDPTLAANYGHPNDYMLSVDWSKLNIKIKPGAGMGGNETGGAIPAEPGAIDPAPPADPPDVSGEPPVSIPSWLPPATGVGVIDQQDLLSVVETVNIISQHLGAQIADEVEGWVANGGPLGDVLDVVYAAGAAGTGPLDGDQHGQPAPLQIAADLYTGFQDLGVNPLSAWP